MEENAIDDAEDYSRSADAEGKGENGDSGEPRTFPQDPQAVTNILDERFDEAHPARGARLPQASGRIARALRLASRSGSAAPRRFQPQHFSGGTGNASATADHSTRASPKLSCPHLKFRARSATYS